MPKCGIYKIINPNGKIYVGQSTDIEWRWEQYNKYPNSFRGQRKLYNSIMKYGVNNHKFEIIEECEVDNLDDREIYWGTHYGVLGDKGLTLKLGNGKQIVSPETKQKMSESIKGKKKGKESIGSGRKAGFKYSDEVKQKMREAKLNKPSNHKGHKDSIETLIKKSQAKIGKPSSKKGKIYKNGKSKVENISQ
jgi:group I intron endonuclease